MFISKIDFSIYLLQVEVFNEEVHITKVHGLGYVLHSQYDTGVIILPLWEET